MLVKRKTINRIIHLIEMQITDEETAEWAIDVIKDARDKLPISADNITSGFEDLEI